MIETVEEHEQLVEALLNRDMWPDGGNSIQKIETHISSVILAGGHAYKIKKPLDLAFLDYSTLDKRKQACFDEVRLNRRLAPEIYEAAVPITGDINKPVIEGEGRPIEWAVKMKRFDSESLLSNMTEDLTRGLIEKLAVQIAHFHESAAVSSQADLFGTPESIYGPMQQNFSQIRSRRSGDRRLLDELSEWSEQCFCDLRQVMEQRKLGGHIRECHGDFHLGNIALIEGETVPFDGIEFNPDLRWIDTVNDLAFLTMDLTRIGRNDLARWFRNAYLQETGDYQGLSLLRFYEVYRAMVRAKVQAIRAGQRDLSMQEREQVVADLRRYLRIAEAFTRPGLRALVITQGVAASGKSTLSGSLIGKLPAVRVRSDVERKRLAGLAPEARVLSDQTGAIYNTDMTERTYDRLAECAEQIIQAGFIALVDATFLKASYRQRFADLAHKLDVPFVILTCDVPEHELRRRIEERQQLGTDVSDATLGVMVDQLKSKEPLSRDEQAYSLQISPDTPLELDDLLRRLK